ncbi:tRNA pseudouridine synthase B [Rhizoctonia solani]|uniref:tRNA pseudouridine(55) synthase n=1 Tax=Rhizoctonia solani TaxID=456999 RepID=A0A0K6FPJ1_9AGAM|nr:tRNA pseudouridine synthase B [Rhizoctonia solani]
MPKVSTSSLPLDGLFAIVKPSGPTSMSILDRLKPLLAKSRLLVDQEEYQKVLAEREKKKKKNRPRSGRMSKPSDRPKLGQGGTLDPLADGVLVLGVNKGTKSLGQFLECTKEYRTTGLLGCETDSYDSKGSRVRTSPYAQITREDVEKILERFRGEIQQMPPIFSALKMDGKPLYEYARENKPLPRPIEARACTVHELVLERWIPAAQTPNDAEGHHYTFPENEITEEQRTSMNQIKELVLKAEVDAHPSEEQSAVTNALRQATPLSALAGQPDAVGPPAFVLRMVVSSGTYVRSIVHDIGMALGSAAHVVTLTRTRQGKYNLASAQAAASQSSASPGVDRPELMDGNCIKWEVFERALALTEGEEETSKSEGEEWEEWEQAILQSWSED